ncbi:sugar isomerase domain-containing protein [Streptomyces sp. B6B3]|uniref:sugar isomerase domain-containing protein n=1 Tax=Streptomyces sp. B6B3 TaxID=3153570 RepID=UPI00325DA9ED
MRATTRAAERAEGTAARRPVTVAVDGGKSGCRAALYVAGARLASVAGPGLPHPAEPGAPEAIAAAVGALTGRLPDPARRPDTLVAGLTGVTEDPASAAGLPWLLATATGAVTALVCGDVVTSYAGALGAVPGVVLAAGTGTVVLGVGADGRTAVVDGWGHLLGDAGSGFDIARRALDLALRAEDGRAGSTGLRDLAVRRFGPLGGLPGRLSAAERPAEAVAAFAADVARAAASGDPAARDLLADAGRDLARAIAAAARRAFPETAEPVPVAWTGGLVRAGAILTGPLTEELAALLPHGAPRPARGDALDGGLALAHDPGPLRGLLHPHHTSTTPSGGHPTMPTHESGHAAGKDPAGLGRSGGPEPVGAASPGGTGRRSSSGGAPIRADSATPAPPPAAAAPRSAGNTAEQPDDLAGRAGTTESGERPGEPGDSTGSGRPSPADGRSAASGGGDVAAAAGSGDGPGRIGGPGSGDAAVPAAASRSSAAGDATGVAARAGVGAPEAAGGELADVAYLDALRANLGVLVAAERPAVERAARAIAGSIAAGGVVHYFGSGHSQLVALEPLQRAGGLAPVNVIADPALSPHAPRHAGAAERVAGYAAAILATADIRAGEVVVVVSNSGINAVPIEFALGARERGATVVALTNRAHSLAAVPRHATGRRLLDVADIVIDTHGRLGDTVVPVADVTVGALSTVVGAALVNALTCRVAQLLAEEHGQSPPLLISQNAEGDAERHNSALLARHRDRCPTG